MYGHMHAVIKKMVEVNYGRQTWKQILYKSELNEKEDFMGCKVYPDKKTFALLGAVSDVTNTPLDKVLKSMGYHFINFWMNNSYDKLLSTLGGDLVSFMENVDSLHSMLISTFTDLVAPSFRCIEQDGQLQLHYNSVRQGLAPFVIGVVEAVSDRFFHEKVTLSVEKERTLDTGRDQKMSHVEFKVRVEPRDNVDPPPIPAEPVMHFRSRRMTVPSFDEHSRDPGTHSVIKLEDFNAAFPFNILMDRFLFIRECGDSVQRLAHVPLIPGTPFREVASILHPPIVPSTQNIFNFINSTFTVSLNRSAEETPFIMIGQMMWLPHCYHILFIGSPRLTSLEDFRSMKLFLSDVPIYDNTREFVLLSQQRIAEIDVARCLDEATMELKNVSREVEEEKQRTGELLRQMLPQRIASQLTAGMAVLSEKFESCTVLFGSIVAFTQMVMKCTPDDIINMLNNLFHRFDTHTDNHGVYKVDTIGDAYMAVTGVPDVQADHAQRMAEFAMDMLEEVGTVFCSNNKSLPLKWRVGIHSGGVIAGVIGTKRPRYDIYGDTVNTASRMGTYSSGNRIHVSRATFDLLYPCGYKFRNRGEITVKGKGLMKTYFLVGHPERTLQETNDAFTDLKLVVCLDPVERVKRILKDTQRAVVPKVEFVTVDSSQSTCANKNIPVSKPSKSTESFFTNTPTVNVNPISGRSLPSIIVEDVNTSALTQLSFDPPSPRHHRGRAHLPGDTMSPAGGAFSGCHTPHNVHCRAGELGGTQTGRGFSRRESVPSRRSASLVTSPRSHSPLPRWENCESCRPVEGPDAARSHPACLLGPLSACPGHSYVTDVTFSSRPPDGTTSTRQLSGTDERTGVDWSPHSTGDHQHTPPSGGVEMAPSVCRPVPRGQCIGQGQCGHTAPSLQAWSGRHQCPFGHSLFTDRRKAADDIKVPDRTPTPHPLSLVCPPHPQQPQLVDPGHVQVSMQCGPDANTPCVPPHTLTPTHVTPQTAQRHSPRFHPTSRPQDPFPDLSGQQLVDHQTLQGQTVQGQTADHVTVAVDWCPCCVQ